MQTKTTLFKAIALGIVSLLLSEILCLLTAMTFAALAVNLGAAKPLSILCTIGIHVGLMADYANKMAKRDLVEERRFQVRHAASRPVILALATTFPLWLLWGILLVCKLGSLGNFIPFYALLNAHFFQVIHYICGDTALTALSLGKMGGLLLLTLIPAVTIFSVYQFSYRGKNATDFQYQ